MKLKDLKAQLELDTRHHGTRNDEEEVKIRLTSPSVGPVASSDVKSGYFGFDWDKGLILVPKDPLVVKTQHEAAFDQASDLLMYLGTKPMKRETYEKRTAKAILLRVGYTQEQLDKYSKFFHKEKV